MKEFSERDGEGERAREIFVSLWNGWDDECDAQSYGNHIITRRENSRKITGTQSPPIAELLNEL